MYRLLALVIALISTPVFAGDYVVNVHGIVCSFCAQGVIKKVSKLPFVDRSKYTNGVKVEIEDQKVTIAVRDDLVLDTTSLFDAIKSGGYFSFHISVSEGLAIEKHAALGFALFQLESFYLSGECVSSPA